jgi:hypothetical protein
MPIHYQYMTGSRQTPVNNPGHARPLAFGHGFVTMRCFCYRIDHEMQTPLVLGTIDSHVVIDPRRFHLDKGGIISVL